MFRSLHARALCALAVGSVLLSATACSSAESAPKEDVAQSGSSCAALDPSLAWYGDNRVTLDAMMTEFGTCGAAGDVDDGAPLALFDWDNTVVKNDIGSATAFWMIKNNKVLQPAGGDWGNYQPLHDASRRCRTFRRVRLRDRAGATVGNQHRLGLRRRDHCGTRREDSRRPGRIRRLRSPPDKSRIRVGRAVDGRAHRGRDHRVRPRSACRESRCCRRIRSDRRYDGSRRLGAVLRANRRFGEIPRRSWIRRADHLRLGRTGRSSLGGTAGIGRRSRDGSSAHRRGRGSHRGACVGVVALRTATTRSFRTSTASGARSTRLSTGFKGLRRSSSWPPIDVRYLLPVILSPT